MHKIRLFAYRSMGEKVNATFDFVKVNWRVWLKYMIYILLPLSMLQGIGIDTLIGEMVSETADSASISYGMFTAYSFICIAASLVCAVTLTLLKIYNEREQGLDDITFKEVWPQLWRNSLRMFAVGLFFAILVTPVYLIACLVLMLVPIIGNVIAYTLVLPLFLFPVIYVFESNLGFVNAGIKAVKLGFSQWVHLAFVGIVMVVLVLMLTMVTMMPWIFVEVFKYELFNDISWVNTVFGVLVKVVTVANCFAIHLAVSFYVLTLAFHYGSVSDVDYEASLKDDINNFENL